MTFLQLLRADEQIGCPARLHCCRPIVFGWGGVAEVQMRNMQILLYKFGFPGRNFSRGTVMSIIATLFAYCTNRPPYAGTKVQSAIRLH